MLPVRNTPILTHPSFPNQKKAPPAKQKLDVGQGLDETTQLAQRLGVSPQSEQHDNFFKSPASSNKPESKTKRTPKKIIQNLLPKRIKGEIYTIGN